MSILNNAFWHKGQRDVVGSRVIQPSTIAANSNDLVTGAEVLWYTIASTAGQSYSKAAASAIDLSALTALHENNPATTRNDDSAVSPVSTRQNASGLVVAASNHVRIIITIDVSGNFRGYAGEIVATTVTAPLPELDLDDEWPIAMLVVTGSKTLGGSAASAHALTILAAMPATP